MKWSNAQCPKSGVEATGGNKRAVIGDALYQIRFPTMSQKEFGQNVSRSGVLTAEEVNSIYDKFTGYESPGLKWRQPERNRPLLKGFKRCNLVDVKGPRILGWNYTLGKPDRLCFSVNKAATFHGVYLFGDDKGSKYEVTLEVDSAKVTDTYNSECNSEGVYGFNVMFPTPISLEKNKVVTMAAMIKGPKSYSGRKGKKLVEVDKVIVTFGNAFELGNGTNVILGQFYEIILSLKVD